jgi:protein-S-isoprenylcysteine O-methyltransferase Ste14
VANPAETDRRPAFGLRPPVVAVLLFAAAWGLEALAGAGPVVPLPWRWAGLLPFGAGLALAVTALLHFHARRTTHDPFGTPTSLVTTGPYRRSRNPMYVGLLVASAGAGVLRGTVPFLAVAPALFLVLRTQQVPWEEARMERLFGEAYLAWKARTRRWL